MGSLFPGIGEVAGAVRQVLNRHPGTRRARRSATVRGSRLVAVPMRDSALQAVAGRRPLLTTWPIQRPAWGRRVMVRASLASIVVASLAVAAFPALAGANVSELSGQPRDRALPAAAAPGSGWSVARSPNPLIRTGQLFWVSCPAADSCVAVGTYVRSSGAGVTLAERWDGSRWRLQPVPSPPGAAWSALNGVSCVSPSACEAVGITVSRSGARRAVAERWNGTRWQIQPAPSPGGGYLVGVSCTSPAACTAVGGSTPGPPGKALAERWDGSRWRVQATPSPAGSAFLSGVACMSSSACTAIGGSDAGT